MSLKKLKCWDCRNKEYCPHTQNKKVKLNLDEDLTDINKTIGKELCSEVEE